MYNAWLIDLFKVLSRYEFLNLSSMIPRHNSDGLLVGVITNELINIIKNYLEDSKTQIDS